MLSRVLKLILIAATVVLIAVGAAVVYLWLSLRSSGVDLKAADRPADQRILLVGNSFTEFNDLASLVSHLTEAADPAWDDVLVVRVAPGGYTLAQHLADVQNADENPALRQLLVSGSATLRDWDLVVFQEQSQIPGLSNDVPAKQVSLNSAAALVRQAQATGAAVGLLMTWGYQDGDPSNPGIYPNYLAMQTRLMQGYDNMAGLLAAGGTPVFVAPAGLGFQLVYEDIIQAGGDPLASGSPFRQLYADGQHPSLAGSYLAACILTASYTGHPLGDVAWKPKGLNADFAAYLRTAADRVVFGDRFPGRRYPLQQERRQ